MKKLLIALFAVALVAASLTGCSGSRDDDYEDDEYYEDGEGGGTGIGMAEDYRDYDLSDFDNMYTQYLEPVFLSAITSESWDSADQIAPDRLVAFYHIKNGSQAGEEASAGDVEKLVQQYFDLPSGYIEQAGSLAFDGPESGASAAVVGIEEEDDGTMILFFEYYGASDDDVIRMGLLTLDMNNGGKYVRCESIEF